MTHPYIAFESSESCGKTTQLGLLRERYGDKFFFTKEPGSEHLEVCKAIREILLDPRIDMHQETEALLYAADRFENTVYALEKREERPVITDRSIVSSLAYQTVSGRLDAKDIFMANCFSEPHCLPDLVFYFELDEETRKQRMLDRGEALDRMEQKGDDFLLEAKKGFENALSYVDEVIIVDASKTIEEVHEFIVKELEARGII